MRKSVPHCKCEWSGAAEGTHMIEAVSEMTILQ